jgi:predicted CXXCH cytochrome family protein
MNELRATAALFACSALVGVYFTLALPQTTPPHPATPKTHKDEGYVGSGTCKGCHPAEYESWHRSYHRSMTRQTRELSWDGDDSPALPVEWALHAREFSLFRQEGKVLYRGPDLHAIGRVLASIAATDSASAEWKRQRSEDAFRAGAEVVRELALVTGSHYYLAFWVEGGEGRELRQLPFVYLLDDEVWLPREEAFLQPPEALPHIARWNAGCIQCHAVAGQPRQSEGIDSYTNEFWENYDTRVAEVGISCEACHGPGSAHAERFRNPLARLRAQGDSPKLPADMFVPGKTATIRGSETCGQCHSYFVPRNPNLWWDSGFSTTPSGEAPLTDSRLIFRRTPSTEAEHLASQAISQDPETVFWADGSIIVGGREYNGLSKSPCFVKGEGDRKLSCTSCHSMHKGEPNKQLDPRRTQDELCTQCHQSIEQGHSRHAAGSSGATCINCHMPKTSYALLHGIAAHQISSPKVSGLSAPSACSLCHVAASRSWISSNLAKFYAPSQAPPPDSVPGAVRAPGTSTDPELPLAIVRAL